MEQLYVDLQPDETLLVTAEIVPGKTVNNY